MNTQEIAARIESINSLRADLEGLKEYIVELEVDLSDAEGALRDASTISIDTDDEDEQEDRDCCLNEQDAYLADCRSLLLAMPYISTQTRIDWIKTIRADA